MANQLVDRKQQTVVWHNDDFIIKNVDSDVKTQLIGWFQTNYGGLAPLAVQQRKKHDYLGMILDFEEKGSSKLSMTSVF